MFESGKLYRVRLVDNNLKPLLFKEVNGNLGERLTLTELLNAVGVAGRPFLLFLNSKTFWDWSRPDGQKKPFYRFLLANGIVLLDPSDTFLMEQS